MLEKHTIDSEEEVKVKVNDEFEKVKKEIEEYKQKRMQEIDQKITKALPQLSKEIFGKSMTIDDHEAAIFSALEDAKKEKVFEI